MEIHETSFIPQPLSSYSPSVEDKANSQLDKASGFTTQLLSKLKHSPLDSSIKEQYREAIQLLKNKIHVYEAQNQPNSNSTYEVSQQIADVSQPILSVKELKEELQQVEEQFTQVEKLVKAQKVLDLSTTEPIPPHELQSMAINLLHSYKQSTSKIPITLTLVHLLLERAADQLIQQGEVQQALEIRLMAATLISFDENHPLHDMKTAIDKGAQKQTDPSFGAFFSQLDSTVLKGGNLRAFNRNIEGHNKHVFDFKINYFARKDMQKTIDEVIKLSEGNPQFLTQLTQELGCKEITIKSVDYTFKGREENGAFTNAKGYSPEKITNKIYNSKDKTQALEIEFVGMGKITVGVDSRWSLYQTVTVEIDEEQRPGEGIANMHKLVTMLGLGPILGHQRKEDEKRMQVAQIFRAYYPKAAYELERTKEYFQMPFSQMMETIIKKEKDMQPIFKHYFQDHPELLKKEEIYPGKEIWSLADLSEKMRKKGAIGLMSGIQAGRIEQAIQQVCLMIKNGALSSQDRFTAGLFNSGASSEQDLSVGSGDQVFTRMITEKNIHVRPNGYDFAGKIQVLYDLDVLNRVSYGYDTDSYGIKYSDKYAKRDSLIDLVDKIKPPSSGMLGMMAIGGGQNEVMVKNRIDPSFIRGVLVQGLDEAKQLLKALRAQGLVEVRDGKEFIMGKPVEQFIFFPDNGKFSANMWNKP